MSGLAHAEVARPFYAIAHHCNLVEQARGALETGANAIECDIVWDDGLWVRHPRDVLEPLPRGTPLDEYLTAVRELADQFQEQWALIIFDLKPSLSGPQVAMLLDRVRLLLTDDSGLKCFFTAPHFEGRAVLDYVLGKLRSGEGAGIDEDDDPDRIAAHFAAKGFEQVVFGNGIAPMLPDFMGGPLHASLKRALTIQRDTGKIKFVCRWTLNRKAAMANYFELGVDGIMTDDVTDLIAAVHESKTPIRLATRSDNPFT